MNIDKNHLIDIAREAAQKAYAPYSNYSVGAALLTANGKIYRGCNIENCAYGDTMCAERVALFNAVSDGQRDFKAIAIAGGDKRPAYPCGSCRQVLSEFGKGDMKVYCSTLTDGKIEEYTLSDLLPVKFPIDDLRN